MRQANIFRYMTFGAFLLLAACGGGEDSNEKDLEKKDERRSIENMTISERKQSVISALNVLEKEGDLPKLDTKDDRSGSDLDLNGIRDDIDFYIAEKSYTQNDRVILNTIARELQIIQTARSMTPSLAESIALNITAAQQCILEKSSDPKHIRDISRNLVTFIVNTEERIQRMAEYENHILAESLPSSKCDRILFPTGDLAKTEEFQSKNIEGEFKQTCFQQALPPRDRIAVGFFNGVGNSVSNAEDSLFETITVIQEAGKSFDPKDDYYYDDEYFYNKTHSLYQDIIETFRQRAASKGLSPEAEALIETHPQLIPLLSDPSGHPNSYKFKKHLDNFEFFIFVKSFHALQAEYGNHGDELNEIYADHRAQIEKWKNENRKMILVAHSQGNLFVNKAYEAALEMGVSPDDIKVVHVAPASLKRYGDYVLADVDTIIRPLLNTPPVNAYNGYPRVFDDPTGHGYIETYLDRDLDSGKKTIDAIIQAYEQVSTFSEILNESQDEINKFLYPKIYPNPSMELFRFYATSENWTNDINVDVKEYSGDLLSPNESKSDYANNVHSVYDSLSSGDILAVDCKVDEGIKYVTWDFEINFKYKGDLESVSQFFLVSIKHENYSGDLFRASAYKDVGVEGNRPTYTLRASVSAEIIPTDLDGQFRVKLKGRDGETETIVRKYYE